MQTNSSKVTGCSQAGMSATGISSQLQTVGQEDQFKNQNRNQNESMAFQKSIKEIEDKLFQRRKTRQSQQNEMDNLTNQTTLKSTRVFHARKDSSKPTSGGGVSANQAIKGLHKEGILGHTLPSNKSASHLLDMSMKVTAVPQSRNSQKKVLRTSGGSQPRIQNNHSRPASQDTTQTNMYPSGPHQQSQKYLLKSKQRQNSAGVVEMGNSANGTLQQEIMAMSRGVVAGAEQDGRKNHIISGSNSILSSQQRSFGVSQLK